MTCVMVGSEIRSDTKDQRPANRAQKEKVLTNYWSTHKAFMVHRASPIPYDCGVQPFSVLLGTF